MKQLVRGFLLAIPLAGGGCAAAPGREVESPRDQVTGLRAALVTMANDESARGVQLELERARGWLSEADAAMAKEDPPSKVALLIALSRNQLILVKSIVERRKAEAALAQMSDEYRKAREAMEPAHPESKASEPASGEPRGDTR